MTTPKIYEDVAQWESRQLGADEAFVKKSATTGEELDAALGLKPISIRLMLQNLDSPDAADIELEMPPRSTAHRSPVDFEED